MKKIYIEAGANDGIFQSRSLHLTKNDEYYGILVEPIPYMYEQCLYNRKFNTKIYNCALVDFNYVDKTIPINIHNIYSAMCSVISHDTEKYAYSLNIEARTLDSILEENNINQIDSFYLDVEGYEYNVLNGINFSKRQFNMIEIECHYNFLNITLEEEQSMYINFLNKFNYKLTNKNIAEGNTKLVFNHE